MGMESFYGGRQGASFVIVKRFDGIDIPEKSAYKVAYYAVDSNKVRRYPFIQRTDQNYYDYDWLLTTLDGSTVDVVLADGTLSTQVVGLSYQEGMRQCFEKGGDSVDVVNYGEYVIIDTVSKDNPENGKVYRRGMNFDYNATTNPLAGAEYIGQIIGPKGSTAEIDLVSYKEATDYDPHQERKYTVDTDNQGLVPGVDVDRTEFEDSIHYAWTTIRDDAGNVTNYQVGFKFPYLVPEFSGSARSPYYTQEDLDLGRIDDADLIGTPIRFADDFDLFIDNGWDTDDREPDHGDTGHPFYRKWKINIPKGIKGDSNSELKIFPTIVIKGSKAYAEAAADGTLGGDEVELDADAVILVDSYWDTFEKGYVTIEVDGETRYCYLTDTAELHYGYLWTWYDEHEDGRDHKWIDIGQYRTIDHIHLDEYGWVTVYYKAGSPDTLEEALRWVWLNSDPENTKGVQLDADGTLTIWYNTLDEHGEHEYQKYETVFDWLTDMSLNRNGHFKLTYNNDSMYDEDNQYYYDSSDTTTWTPGWTKADDKASWETDLTWPTQINLTNEGVLKFLFNNNLIRDIYPPSATFDGTVDYDEGSYTFIMPWLNKVKLLSDGHFNFVFNNNRLYDDTDPDWQSDEITYAPLITWATKVKLDDDGHLRFFFNNDMNQAATEADGEIWDATDHAYVTQLTWITKATLDADGTFKIYFNNDINKAAVEAEGGTWIDADHAYQTTLAWVSDIDLTDSGLFTFTWNTGDTDEKQVYWVKDVEVAADGTVTFIYCDDTPTVPHRYNSPFKLKYLTDVSINTGTIEGTGNQKVHLTWNTVDVDGHVEEEDIGNPLNYIIESTISIPTVDYPTVPYWHLLVYYSDPELRNSLSDKWVTYPSVKETGIVRTEWVDLGSVKGENTGIHVLKNIESMDELKDAAGEWIPPELLPDADGVILNPDGAGWSCTLQEPGSDITVYLFYDYETKQWYRGTSVDPSAVDPSYVIAKSTPSATQEPIAGDAINLKTNGFWFAVEKGIAVK